MLGAGPPRARRSLLQRSDTAPEEWELERRLEAEWRRRTLARAASVDRPASAAPPRTAYTLPAAFPASCSASCPPTVPATPTRSPRPTLRPNMGAPLAPPPPPPASTHANEPLVGGLGGLGGSMMGGLGGSMVGGGGFQCECLEDRPMNRWEPGVFDMWCSSCTKKRRESMWSSLDLSLPPHQLSSSALLPDTPDTEGMGGLGGLGGLGGMDVAADLIRSRQPPPPSFWDCLVSCHDRLGQRLARKRVEQGVRLYNQQKHMAAVKKWKQALRRINKDNDRFITLGYLSQAHLDWGRYREMLDFGFQQLDIANEMDSPMLRAEAYLTIARANERLGNLEKAVSYCRHSLYNQCDQSRTTGYVQLTLGNTYVTYSSFSKAIEHYELALKVSRSIHDTALELQVYCGLGHTFCLLQDYERSLSFSAKAFELSKTFHILDLNSRYQRLSLVTLATPLRKLGRLPEARDCCQDALKLALTAGDRPTHARCLAILADIHRQCLDVQRAYKRYEASMQLMVHMEDRYGQLIAHNGMAKTLGLMRRQSKICDCRPLEINNKVIDLASSLGCKLIMRSAHLRLAELYRILNDDQNDSLQVRLAACLAEEMELICGVCQERYGDQGGNSLEALPCSHIFHSKCVRDLMASSDRKKKKRICPDCRKSLNSRLMLICYDELKSACNDGRVPTFPRYHPSPCSDDQPL
ncbi:43 kDa receptor-associated protein of the synapse homolog isoform X2 [Eriocheir sinensis]|uniref:43 kDa receptor-associated protein of the synapse homolog isoform X2 n=1 Tax=Eriocheir sinensis TaxID=95602 RepID=UPI0021CAA857|nr:43 kDa receptor-associated protein of the synapse homolog isoform X2 [Eriocheir sinensis]